ncbi:MAG: hypothetical protein WKF37_01415 [Bryobacteraceae bacterium]
MCGVTGRTSAETSVKDVHGMLHEFVVTYTPDQDAAGEVAGFVVLVQEISNENCRGSCDSLEQSRRTYVG